ICQLLQASRQMRCLADDGVFYMQIVADGTDDDLPRVESNSDRHRYPMRPLNLVCISRDGFLHSERRITSAHGMILMANRRTEEGHNPIAHNSVHGALVAVDRLNHALEYRGRGASARPQGRGQQATPSNP